MQDIPRADQERLDPWKQRFEKTRSRELPDAFSLKKHVEQITHGRGLEARAFDPAPHSLMGKDVYSLIREQ